MAPIEGKCEIQQFKESPALLNRSILKDGDCPRTGADLNVDAGRVVLMGTGAIPIRQYRTKHEAETAQSGETLLRVIMEIFGL